MSTHQICNQTLALFEILELHVVPLDFSKISYDKRSFASGKLPPLVYESVPLKANGILTVRPNG